MRPHLSRNELIWLPVVLAALLVIYLPGLDNALVFDDAYLTEGLFSHYSTWADFRTRLVSYGSFVWLQQLAGEGWWKQRALNLAIHAATVVALWALYREILRVIVAPAPEAGAAATPYHRSPALGIAIGFFALNPVAVYSVAYLIQRSILLATFFVVLGLWFFARGLSAKKPWMHMLAFGCYALAVMSKEHAITAPLAAIPLYILIARPGPRRVAALSGAGAVLIAAAAYVLWRRYGEIIGKPFDEYSQVYLAQLRSIDANVEKNAYPLSIINQAYLFFQYGLRWFLPAAGWMSISMRPPFPVSWMTFPHILGAAGYLATVIGGFYLVIRYRDWRALAGLSILFPALLFTTEFATVWVQDPFVLYRSYLWAIGVPGLVFVLIHGPPPRILIAIGLVLACVLAWQALDRVFSMTTPVRAWSDAIEKLPRDPRAVGRWAPYLNRGAAYVDLDQLNLALRDFQASAALGDQGMGTFNMGSVLSGTGKPEQALLAFDRAEKEGYKLYNLPFQRGLALMALGRIGEAHRQFEITRTMEPKSPIRELVLLQLGRASLQLGKHDQAIASVEEFLKQDKDHKEARYLQAMGYIAKGDAARARALLDPWIAQGENGPALYARAMANYGLGRKAEALADIDGAMRLGLDNPTLRQWKARILAMP